MACTFKYCTVPLIIISYESHNKAASKITGINASEPFGSEAFLSRIHA